ncbi:MAG: hypothetical protein A2Z91_08735 [Deltaproteobacteria bacterium GWA2_38_16]|nr:MAG: hypothetical protein A2Z91_08735 [Deltaproteobacteria bacterium GWA2_38_16]OGQ03880.1 MAG: hypothetical protein A3D19_07300 [Deltaproteobacteria bacterium RIFCSPHIGHO2_02_FULL_38_15]OGQ33346.1 MAG: hypothetical protein A3A72_08590 [Deltaproteobacteria bacterium RIFCSPLOWO2_01_FULL_38_9]OGQ59964.1 MAG: hypothetical protein A3G92_03250 [Deltaproteobacteria bacterium RIFCSPLOWO2_12_FULL_38_8]
MNKTELIEKLAKENVITRRESEKVINIVIDTIQKALKKREDVKISGFGRWFVNHRKGRVVKNPQTGEKITIHSFYIPTFRPAKQLKNILRSS